MLGLVLNLAGGIFGMAAGKHFREKEFRCASFGVFDRKICIMSAPKRWDPSKLQVSGGIIATQPGCAEDSTHMVRPTSITTFGWPPQFEPRTLGVSTAEAVPSSGFDTPPHWKVDRRCRPPLLPHHHRARPCYPTSEVITIPESSTTDRLAWRDFTFPFVMTTMHLYL